MKRWRWFCAVEWDHPATVPGARRLVKPVRYSYPYREWEDQSKDMLALRVAIPRITFGWVLRDNA